MFILISMPLHSLYQVDVLISTGVGEPKRNCKEIQSNNISNDNCVPVVE